MSASTARKYLAIGLMSLAALLAVSTAATNDTGHAVHAGDTIWGFVAPAEPTPETEPTTEPTETTVTPQDTIWG
ncbi:hypothetical protein ACWGQT_00040 [Streptomyces yangpuensis]